MKTSNILLAPSFFQSKTKIVRCTSRKCVICRAVSTLHFKSGKFNLIKQHNESISNSLLELLIKKYVIHDGVVCVR